MLNALFIFLIGALVLIAVVYVLRLVMGSLELPPQMQQAVMVIIGIVGLICLLVLAWQALGGNVGPRIVVP